eukprot:scaffold30055_cov118-Isochrysis_galbana.AAC.2
MHGYGRAAAEGKEAWVEGHALHSLSINPSSAALPRFAAVVRVCRAEGQRTKKAKRSHKTSE